MLPQIQLINKTGKYNMPHALAVPSTTGVIWYMQAGNHNENIMIVISTAIKFVNVLFIF